jgi:hypothetical protein
MVGMTAIAILIGLCGYEMAVKLMMVIKMLGINVEGWTQQDFEKLLEKPEFKKYHR